METITVVRIVAGVFMLIVLAIIVYRRGQSR
jgi:hypothetical protein